MLWLGGLDCVADVGSGPAVLTRMLRAEAGPVARAMRWICVDQADWPGARGAMEALGVELRAAENFADALPPAGGVGAVVSNFGLEYLPRDAAVDAVWAWLGSGARLHAVMHASGSVIDRAATSSLADIGYALHEARIFDRAAPMLEAMSNAPADPMERMMHAVEVRDAYNVAVNMLKGRMEGAGTRSAALMDILQGITGLAALVRQGQGLEALARLGRRARDYALECRRLEAMRQCALDTHAVQSLVDAFSRAGLREARAVELDSEIGQIAWVVSGRKP